MNDLFITENFSHKNAQKYEFNYHLNFLQQNFKNIYDEIKTSIARFETDGEMLIGPGNWLKEFFQNDLSRWQTFVKQVKDKQCLEVGSGPCGASCYWHFIKNWHVIDPLVEEYKSNIISTFNENWWWDWLKLHPQNAEIIIPELIDKIDGAIMCRNALDHTENPMLVLNNISQYAAHGCKLLLWTDLYHIHGHDAGHRNVCDSKDKFRTFMTELNFSIDYETPNLRNGPTEEVIEFGCMATKL